MDAGGLPKQISCLLVHTSTSFEEDPQDSSSQLQIGLRLPGMFWRKSIPIVNNLIVKHAYHLAKRPRFLFRIEFFRRAIFIKILEDVVFQFTPTVIPKLSLLAVEDGGWQRA